jgi:prepilin-type N-terminal cleavage/methylation domain-containing protein
MYPRTVGRPPRRTPVSPNWAFQTNAVQTPRSHRAFTLIELLVVIAIIGILMGLLVPSLFSIYERARKTQAKNDLTQIVNAVNAFYTDYGKYPLPSGTSADFTYGPEGTLGNSELFYTLRAVAGGTMNLNNAANPRQIVFISPKAAQRSGIATQTATINGILIAIGDFVDPWGIPYNVEIDGNYDNQFTTNPYPDAPGTSPLYSGVIGWSYGKDQTKGTRGGGQNFTGSDDVISWQ